MPKRRNVLAALLAAVAVLVGAGSALADDGSSKTDRGEAFRNAVAAKLGVTPEQLQAAFAAAAVERIDAAVASGKITAERAAKLKQAIADGKGLKLGKRFHKRGKGLVKRVAWFSASAEYLDMDKDALKAALTQGTSLAQVASTLPGKTTEGLVNALLAKVSDRLDKAVEKGRITAERKQELLGKAKERVEKLVAKQFKAKTT